MLLKHITRQEGRAAARLLGQRRVEHPAAAKALVQPHSAAENAAEADVLAKAERPDGMQAIWVALS